MRFCGALLGRDGVFALDSTDSTDGISIPGVGFGSSVNVVGLFGRNLYGSFFSVLGTFDGGLVRFCSTLLRRDGVFALDSAHTADSVTVGFGLSVRVFGFFGGGFDGVFTLDSTDSTDSVSIPGVGFGSSVNVVGLFGRNLCGSFFSVLGAFDGGLVRFCGARLGRDGVFTLDSAHTADSVSVGFGVSFRVSGFFVGGFGVV